MHRREYLAGTAAVGIAAATAGCTAFIEGFQEGASEDRKHELAGEEAWVSTSVQSAGRQSRLTATVELDRGEYAAYDLEPQATVRYDMEWETDGNPASVLVLDEQEYNSRWREGDEVQYNASLAELGTTSASTSGVVNPGQYVLVVSNSEAYGDGSEGPVTVDLEILATV